MNHYIEWNSFSDAGVKPQNEDACGLTIPEDPNSIFNKGITAAIADGVSSSEYGKEASNTSVSSFLHDYYSTSDSWTAKTCGQRILGALNRWLYGRSSHQHRGMLTTFTATIIKSTTLHIFHVGDTRVWRIRAGELKQLTRDHNHWISEKELFLSRALGADVHIEIDYSKHAVELDDVYLLTSDGVHGFMSSQSIIDLFRSHAFDSLSKTIVTEALKNKSNDNATCLAFKVKQYPLQDDQDFYQHINELPFPPPLEAGMKIDGFNIIRQFHASKRTEVYLAENDKHEKVVIKAPSINYIDDAEFIDGFLHEEWIGRRLKHSHLLKILPSRNRHFLYYCTEYIEGQSLRQWMNDQGQCELEQLRKILKQVANGLNALHRMEMIHQDIKPENIMLDNRGTVKIIDYGSTQVLGIAETQRPIQFRQSIMGTMNYTAPEYFDGSRGSFLSDQFSLGVLAYEMLTTKLPYGEKDKSSNYQKCTYVPASTYNKSIPAWIDAALEKAVSINAKSRYAELSEFIYDLDHPNNKLLNRRRPVIEKYPIGFWRSISLILLLTNFILLYLLLRN